MQAFDFAGDDGTDFVRAESDDEVGVLDINGVDRLGGLPHDIDADFGHHGNRAWIHSRGLAAGALNIDAVTEQMAREPFRHLAAGGVGNTKKHEPRGRHRAIIDQ